MSHRFARHAAFFTLVLASVCAHAAETVYALDPVHTRVMFAVSHAGFSNPMGTVSGTTGTLVFDPDNWASARVEAKIPLDRLDLGDKKWNAAVLGSHLPGCEKASGSDVRLHARRTGRSHAREGHRQPHAAWRHARSAARRRLPPGQAPSDAAVPPHRGFLRDGHVEPQGVRDHVVAERRWRCRGNSHRSRRTRSRDDAPDVPATSTQAAARRRVDASHARGHFDASDARGNLDGRARIQRDDHAVTPRTSE